MKRSIALVFSIIGALVALVVHSTHHQRNGAILQGNNGNNLRRSLFGALNISTSSHGLDPKTVQLRSVGNIDAVSRSQRIAIVTFGLLDHNRSSRPPYKAGPADVSLEYSVRSLNQFVIEPARKQGYEVDVFVHSWNVAERDTIINLYNPTSYLIEEGSGMFESIDAGLRLRKEYEEKHSITYDWVFVVRHDIYYRNDFEFNRLNPSLFYIANWCIAASSAQHQHTLATEGPLNCHELERYNTDKLGGVPDFWFLASPTTMDHVFLDFTRDLESRVFRPTKAFANHGKLGGRLFPMHDRGEIQIGRYKAHHIDFSLYRWRAPRKERVSELGLMWREPNDNDVAEIHRDSVCGGTHCSFNACQIDFIEKKYGYSQQGTSGECSQ